MVGLRLFQRDILQEQVLKLVVVLVVVVLVVLDSPPLAMHVVHPHGRRVKEGQSAEVMWLHAPLEAAAATAAAAAAPADPVRRGCIPVLP